MYVVMNLYEIRASSFVLAKVLGVNTYQRTDLAKRKMFLSKIRKKLSQVLLNVETKFEIEILLEGWQTKFRKEEHVTGAEAAEARTVRETGAVVTVAGAVTG